MERDTYTLQKVQTYKQIQKVESDNTYCNFYVIRSDCKQAWRIKDFQLNEDCAKEIWLANARRYEYFFHIPYGEAELIEV